MTTNVPPDSRESRLPETPTLAEGSPSLAPSLELRRQLLRLEKLFRNTGGGSADLLLRRAVVNYRSGLNP